MSTTYAATTDWYDVVARHTHATTGEPVTYIALLTPDRGDVITETWIDGHLPDPAVDQVAAAGWLA